ncbi:MAG: hypothetical protein HY035_11690 [Nitrospirae bacterium]|nr:hypothetical protein [Nitrospirota bacterium]
MIGKRGRVKGKKDKGESVNGLARLWRVKRGNWWSSACHCEGEARGNLTAKQSP